MNKDLNKASRKLVQILRHQILEYNLNIDSKGYVKLNDLLQLREFKHINISDIQCIVENNQKKRFDLININGEYYIRVVQGHNNIVGSMIDDNLALERIDSKDLKILYHGTQRTYIDSILSSGLKRMGRKHIHLVDVIDTKEQISGFRRISDAIIVIDVQGCMENNIIFYKSQNNVVLTEGINGIIPKEYIIDVIYRN